MTREWTAGKVLELMRRFQPACVLAAAADLELFDALAPKPRTAAAVTRAVRSDLRGTTILLDALVALRLLERRQGRYSVPQSVAALLRRDGAQSILPMVQHQANCLRRWVQLAKVIRTGKPAKHTPSIRGAAGDTASFISAMHVINVAIADRLVRAIQPMPFRLLLDIGGGSGTWTMAFLRANPGATATLFDLPAVIPLARRRLTAAGFRNRVKLVAGDFLKDALPRGADLAWVSAIVHQNSRAQNRSLFRKVFRVLDTDGYIAIRDIVMDETHTAPVAGALFAVNMLVGTKGGGTFTFAELRADLESAGFTNVVLHRRDEGMNSVVVATRP